MLCAQSTDVLTHSLLEGITVMVCFVPKTPISWLVRGMIETNDARHVEGTVLRINSRPKRVLSKVQESSSRLGSISVLSK